MKVWIYCLLMIFVDVGNWHLVQFIHRSCMFVTFEIENSEECSTRKFNVSQAWGRLTIGVGYSSTSYPSIGSSFKSKPKYLLHHVANAPTQSCLQHVPLIKPIKIKPRLLNRPLQLQYVDQTATFKKSLPNHVNH